MSAALPANRVHLVLAGLPQRNAEPLALNICAALQFAAQTFPEFQAFAQTDLGADGFPEGFRNALADLTPEFLAQIADMVTAGVAADRQASEIPDAATHSFEDRYVVWDHDNAEVAYGPATKAEATAWLAKYAGPAGSGLTVERAQ